MKPNNKEKLRALLKIGWTCPRVSATNVKFEKVDYAEINEINHLLSKARDRQREEDFYAELSANDYYVGPND